MDPEKLKNHEGFTNLLTNLKELLLDRFNLYSYNYYDRIITKDRC